MLAVIVSIEVIPGKADDLILALMANQKGSTKEPGCLKWEWSRHLRDPDRFAIYEVYRDEKAFLEHKESKHFAAWMEAGLPCIQRKEANQYEIEGPDLR